MMTQVSEPTVQNGYSSASFHPDGLILGTGTAESLVRIWDVKSQVCSITPLGSKRMLMLWQDLYLLNWMWQALETCKCVHTGQLVVHKHDAEQHNHYDMGGF